MTAKTHEVIAFASLVTLAVMYPPTQLSWSTVIVALIANIVGALLPDIDQASNRLWDLVPGGNMVGKVLRRVFISHRTLSHSFLGIWLVWTASYRFLPHLFNLAYVDPWIVIAALLTGYISHLAADGLTEEGLPLLFPLKIKFGFPPIRSWRIKTGRWFEKFIIFPVVILYIIGFGLINSPALVGLLGLITSPASGSSPPLIQ